MKTHITTNVINEKEKINILLISGVHGNELTSIKALSLFSKNNNFKYRSIKTITCIHGINIEGIRKCVRDIPKDDNNDLNRMFKDEFNPFEILKSHIEKNDIIIDVHSSYNLNECVLIDIDENASSIIRFCNKIGIPYCCRYSSNSTIKKYAFSQNKIGITLELNGMNNIDYQSAFEYGSRYIYNILSKIDLLIKFKQTLDQVNIKPYVSQICNHEGIFEQNYINGDLIKENQTFGQIYDLDGSVVEDCLTTSSGRFLGGGNKGGYVKVGDEIGIIQPEIKY